jgi:hypothetical protein
MWLATAPAWAGNQEPMLVASLVHQGGSESPWGIEIGAQLAVAAGDDCDHPFEYPDCRASQWWPAVGPRAAVSWRGGTRFGAEIEGLAGVAAIDAEEYGFFPIFELEATAGVAIEGGEGPSLTFGGRATKSLSVTVSHDLANGTSSRDYGLPALSGTFAVQERWSNAPLTTRWGGGLQLSTQASSDFKMVEQGTL